MNTAAIMLVALAIDAVLGWPDALYRRIGHPVTWIGALIAALDRALNRAAWPDAARRAAGVVAALAVIAVAALAGAVVQAALPDGWAGVAVAGVLAWPLVAARSLHQHVAAVLDPLAAGDLPGARAQVAMIVGRDPSRLDAAGVTRAAIESLAENTSDGVVAPLFWGAVLGLPGIAAYKAINTLDSMIGHRSPRHLAFGWAAARIDDVANLIPARLTALAMALAGGVAGGLAGGRPRGGVRAALACALRDAPQHRSPNAGWPEAAMAGALDVRLSGPRIYGDRVAAEPWVNAGAPDPGPDDLARALALYRRAVVLVAAALALAAPVS